MINTFAISSLRGARVAKSRSCGGFSLVEILTLIAIMGVLSTVTVMMLGNQTVRVKETKLNSDVASLNQLVAAYLADGGTLKGLTNAQAVLDKMKRTRVDLEVKRQHTGATSGRLVDTRLKARTTTAASRDGSERARWNTQKQRFEMTASGGSAVTEFYFDESLRNVDFGYDTTRAASRLKYNKDKGWVWGDTTTATGLAYSPPGTNNGTGILNPFNPDEDLPTPPPTDPGGGSGGDPGGGSGGGGDPGGGGSTTTPATLPRPGISPAGGTYSFASFPPSLTFSPNGAPGGSASRLEYRRNGGSWTPYDGSPLSVISPDVVEARNVALDTTNFKTSSINKANYYRLTSGFTGNSTGTWGNASGGSALVIDTQNGVDKSTFKHGNTKLDLGNGEFLDAGTENVLSFARKPFETIIPNTWFALGEMVMLNGTTFYSSEAEGVTLSINLNLTEPAQTGVVHINLGLISTENTSDRTASADIVELRNPNTDFSVDIDGVTYRLELGWATLDPGAGISQGNQFLIYEGASARAELRARFVSNH
ncbi:MAG: choice-of-anchor K domain-containing protein [Verrucomicrobiota bacterium]